MDADSPTPDSSPICEKYAYSLTRHISQKNEIFEGSPMKPILKDFRAHNVRFHSTAHIILCI